jgi:acyl carrier protein
MIFNKIRDIIADKLEVDPEVITLNSSLESLDVDSLYLVEIMMAIESELNIVFDDADDIKTIADLVDYTEYKLKTAD